MSVESLAAVLHHSRARGTAKVVLLGIANHDGDNGAYPTVATLARYANVHARKVQEALDRLEELGEVARHLQAGKLERGGERRGQFEQSNLYIVLVECPEGCRGDRNHGPRDGWKRLPDGAYVPVDNSSPDRVPKTAPPAENGTPPPADTGTQTVTRTSDATGSASVTGPREADPPRLLTATCDECSAPGELECLRRQMRLPSDARHGYKPKTTGKKDTGSAGVSSTSASGAAVDNERASAAGDSPVQTSDKRSEGSSAAPLEEDSHDGR